MRGAGSLPPRAPTKLVLADSWLPFGDVGFFRFLSNYSILLDFALNFDREQCYHAINKGFPVDSP